MEMNRDQHFHTYIRGIILIGFTMLLFKLIVTGDIINFIAPRMMPFIYFATGTFFMMGVIQIWRSGSKKVDDVHCGCGTNHDLQGSPIKSLLLYLLFIIPVVTGFMFSNNVLDSSVIEKRGIKYGSGLYTKPPSPEEAKALDTSRAEEYLENPDEYMNNLDQEIASVEGPPLEHPEGFEVQEPPAEYYDVLKQEILKMDKIVVEEDKYIPIMNIIDVNVDQFIGKELEIVGFIYREEDFTEDQVVIARFGLSCCVADASIYGTLSTGEMTKDLENDQWVKAKGTISKITYNDWQLPYLQITELELIEQPKEPYIYEYY
jgi:putative membrane protein